MGLQALQAVPDFVAVVGRQDLGDEGEGPDAAGRSVRAADPLDVPVLVEIGVRSGQQKGPGIQVGRVSLGHESQVGEREQRWQIGIVEHLGLPFAVYLVGEHSFARQVHDPVLKNSRPDRFCKLAHLHGQDRGLRFEDRVLGEWLEDLSGDQGQEGGHHCVAGDVVGKVVGIVGGPEASFDHSGGKGRTYFSLFEFVGVAIESIVVRPESLLIGAVLALLLQGAHQPLKSLQIVNVHKFCGFVPFEVLVAQPKERRQRIELELALPNGLRGEFAVAAEVHGNAEEECLGHIVKVEVPLSRVDLELLECVGIGVSHEELGLGVDESQGEALDFGTILCDFHVGEELVGGVPQPHGFDVASDDVGPLLAGGQLEVLYGCAEGVGIGGPKHGEKLGILSGKGPTIFDSNVSMQSFRQLRASVSYKAWPPNRQTRTSTKDFKVIINNIKLCDHSLLLGLRVLLERRGRLLLRLQNLAQDLLVLALLAALFTLGLAVGPLLVRRFHHDLRVAVLILVLQQLFLRQLLDVFSFLPFELYFLASHYLHPIFAHHLSSYVELWLLFGPLPLQMAARYLLQLLRRRAPLAVVADPRLAPEATGRSLLAPVCLKFLVLGGVCGAADEPQRVVFGVWKEDGGACAVAMLLFSAEGL